MDRTQGTNTEHTAPRPIPAQRGSQAPPNPGVPQPCFDPAGTGASTFSRTLKDVYPIYKN